MDPIIGSNGGGGNAPGGASPAAAGAIKDSDMANFGRDVIEASMQVPVLVDFWAPWCGPCKQLGPVLEKVVAKAGGAVKLVKVNIDENQQLAQQLRIQSIPMVYAFYQGQPLDGFQGALPESQLQEFVDGLIQQTGAAPGQDGEQGVPQEAIDKALEEAKTALDSGKHADAQSIYGQILQVQPENPAALAGLIRCHLAADDAKGAQEVFDALDDETKQKPEVQAAGTAIELAAESAEAAGRLPELREKVEQNPNDHESRFALANALNAAGEREAAAEALLEIVSRKRDWNEEAARKQLVKFFEAWGPTDPLTVETRRRLSSLLFS
ncbi:MAG: thioredoxin [Rhodovibrionaceae bacterium]